ncbi:MAG: response regulator transcription factor, partial [Leptolyngbya sp.]|nr:response regulator transcription factor [Leptolyngbya sp.]
MTDSPPRLMLVDEDPVFRMGLRIWLEQTAGYRVVAEASPTEEVWALLTHRPTADQGVADDNSAQGDPALTIDLVILDLGLGAGAPGQLPGLQLCGEIKARFPTLPVLVLSAQGEPILAAAAQQLGADGFGLRGMPVDELRAWIDQLTGHLPQREARYPAISPAPISPIGPLPAGDPPRLVERPAGNGPSPRHIHHRPAWATLRRHLRQSSLRQIDAVIAAIESERQRGQADPWTEAVMAGRYRELRAARRLMTWILATPGLEAASAWPPPSSQATPVGPGLAQR